MDWSDTNGCGHVRHLFYARMLSKDRFPPVYIFTRVHLYSYSQHQMNYAMKQIYGDEVRFIVSSLLLSGNVGIFYILKVSIGVLKGLKDQSNGLYIVRWEPEGRYSSSEMFRWEPEGRYCCTKSMAIAPFWFSTEHLWSAIAPFWLSADDM